MAFEQTPEGDAALDIATVGEGVLGPSADPEVQAIAVLVAIVFVMSREAMSAPPVSLGSSCHASRFGRL
jgi:hypothetical protein